MRSIDLLDALGEIQDEYILAAQRCREETRTRPRLSRAKMILIAAAVSLLLTGCAYVVYRLQHMKIGEYSPDPAFFANLGQEQLPPPSDMISLQGYAGSPEYQAAKQWHDFCESYDTDGSLLAAANADHRSRPEAYYSYNAYTPAMEQKLEEICETYHLQLLGRNRIEPEVENALYPNVGIRGVHGADADLEILAYGKAYYFPEGSFHIQSTVKLRNAGWDYPISYELRCVKKGSLDGVFLTVGSIEEYDQWDYTTSSGAKVLLAFGPDEALMVADKGEFFLTVHTKDVRVGDVLLGEQAMGRETWEDFADTFDLSFRPVGIGSRFASYAEFLSTIYPTPRGEDLYLLKDLNGDGSDELLTGRHGGIDRILTRKEGRAEVVYASRYCRLTKDNILLDETALDGYSTHRMLRFTGEKMECVEFLEYNPILDAWGKWSQEGSAPWADTLITTEEAAEIFDRYVPAVSKWTPIPSFPGVNLRSDEGGPSPYERNKDRAKAAHYNLLGINPYLYEGTRVFYEGRVYAYRSPARFVDWDSREYVGNLRFDRSFPREELVTDCREIDTFAVNRLTGGYYEDALLITRENTMDLLYLPEDKSFEEDFLYEENADGTITIVKYLGNEPHITVPWEIDGKTVTAIGSLGYMEGAFSNCPSLVSVTIPQGVTHIGDHAFHCCYNLEAIFFPEGVQYIGREAFNLCPLLQDLWFGGDAPILDPTAFDPGGESVDVNVHHPKDGENWYTQPWGGVKLFADNN